jgi:ribosomal protein L11 methyltransferase
MSNTYKTVSFTAPIASKEMIIALLMNEGYEGAEELGPVTSISIPTDAFDEQVLASIMQMFQINYSIEEVAQQNWNAAWEQSFEPVQVHHFAIIRASFHEPVAGVTHDVIITPKMSFGTGHHATTFLMIESMEALDFTQKRVIDFGTGTGVLAILAEKMGATKILATDCDDWSINNAAENILANECKHIQLQQAEGMLSPFIADVVLANINLNVIISNLALIHEACHEATTVLFSGLLVSDEPMISQKIIEAGFAIQKIKHRNNWICISASLKA